MLHQDDCEFYAWKTLFDSEFDDEQFLYHYTSFENACKILYNESLRFSPLARSNDTAESKPKIMITNNEDKEKMKLLVSRFEEINKQKIKLLCFCCDDNLAMEARNNNFDDFSGRGFARPRMWAQYSDNNKGVCFIINKHKLLMQIQKNTVLRNAVLKMDNVAYNPSFTSFPVDKKDLELWFKYIRDINPDKEFEFFKDLPSFISYNYLTKTTDWQQENEYRILLYGEQDLYVKNLKAFCSGIVLGEMMNEMEADIIAHLVNGFCNIKRIKFNFDGCTLENIKTKGYDFYA